MATRKTSKKSTRKAGSRRKTSSRRYGKKASQKVERAMEERKSGTLRSGGSGKKVKSRKQAIAIGLSEARRAGGKVPSRKRTSKRTSKRSGSTRGARRSSRAA